MKLKIDTTGDYDEFYGTLYDSEDTTKIAEIYLVSGLVTDLNVNEAISPSKLKDFIYQVSKEANKAGDVI